VRTRRRNVVQESCYLSPCAVWQMEHAGLKEVSDREDEAAPKLAVRYRAQRPDRNFCVRFQTGSLHRKGQAAPGPNEVRGLQPTGMTRLYEVRMRAAFKGGA
jgi:hypothetical protein